MGYYTNYELEVIKGDLSIEEVLMTLDEESDIYYAVDEYGQSARETKWYNHDKDMKKLSKEFPNLVFRLEGRGEESGDVWFKYYKDGKMQYCPAIITFDEYDESKLSDD